MTGDEHFSQGRAATVGTDTQDAAPSLGELSHSARTERPCATVSPVFAWYDLWIGVFVDRASKRLYVFPVPCFGIVVSWGDP